MLRSLSLTLLMFLLFRVSPARADRKDFNWNSGWKFLNSDAEPTTSTLSWTTVEVPHTWNIENYRRGAGWYAKTFTAPVSWKSKRVFISFEAVSLVADVYLNGVKIGTHEGGFTAFNFELTSNLKLGSENELRVRADNSPAGIAPYSADFNFNGGIYRPVHLIVTDPVNISLLDSGGPGVYISSKEVTPQKASIWITTLISNGSSSDSKIPIRTEILDAQGQRVAEAKALVAVGMGQTEAVPQIINLVNPHLWGGLNDPYLYHVKVRIGDKKGSEKRGNDEIVQPLGIRTVGFDSQERFILNGQLYPIHGVNRHQDWQGKAWAISAEDQKTDFDLIKEVGATAIRLAHYPQSHVFQDLCDQGGMLLWQEIPVVNRILETPSFMDNAAVQMTEMIKQGYNHPSIMVWGTFNEVTAPGTSTPEVLVTRLRDLAHTLDPLRPVVGASDNERLTKLNNAPDHIGFNIYPGWYSASLDDYPGTIESRSKSMNGRRVALSEYGGGGSVVQHAEGTLTKPTANGKFHPEEWQTYLHQRAWQSMKNSPHLWGTFIWSMFDFRVEGRNEGDRPHINDKGLVTDDRKIRKDAFYFYKANWNPEPMVYIAARRMTPRKEASTQVKVFSNASEVELFLNGKSLGTAKPDDVNVFRWEKVPLEPGENHVEVKGTLQGKRLHDDCIWILSAS